MNREMGKRFLFFCIASFVLFGATLGNPFVNFDDAWIVHSSTYQRSFSSGGILAILFDFSHATRMSFGAEYLPVRDVVASLLYRAFGENPMGYRVVSVILYALSCALFLEILFRLKMPRATAWMAALFFLVHPLHVEPVVWLSSLKDLLSFVFFLLAVWLYLQGRWAWAWGSLLLGIFSKYHVLFFPLLLPCMDRVGGRGFRWRIGLLFLVTSVIGWGIATRVSHIVNYGHASWSDLQPWFIPMTWFESLKHFLIPWPLHLLYEPPYEWLRVEALLGASFVGILAAWAWRKDSWNILLGLGCWMGSLLPMLSAPRMHFMADRYLLIASAVLCAGLAVAFTLISSKRVRGAAFISLVVVWSLASVAQQQPWKSSLDLWQHSSAMNPEHPVAMKNLAELYRERKDWENSIAHYRSLSSRLKKNDDDFIKSWTNRGFVAMQLGSYREAEFCFRTALSKGPSFEAWLNLGTVCAIQKRFNCAQEAFLTASRLSPEQTRPLWNLYLLSKERGDAKSERIYREKLQGMDPGSLTKPRNP